LISNLKFQILNSEMLNIKIKLAISLLTILFSLGLVKHAHGATEFISVVDTGGTAYDSSGNNNTGQITSATQGEGKLGQALNFNGTSSYVGMANNSVLALTGDLTISAWVNTATLTGNHTIFGKYYLEEYSLQVNSGVPNFYQGDGTHYDNLNANTTLVANQWHQITVVRNTASKKIFIYNDGNLDVAAGGLSYTYDPVAGSRIAAIGQRSTAGGIFWNGSIDDVRIYNRALSSTEVGDLYRMGKATVKE
jgi:hypothetical protein